MPRRRNPAKRVINPDPKFKNLVSAKFINCMMYCGKKDIAQSIFYKALENASSKLKVEDQEKLFLEIITKVSPDVEVKSKRVGGANYQVPMRVSPSRKRQLAIRWILEAARKRNLKSATEKFTAEFIDIYNGVGNAVKKKEDTHKMADANKAYAHLSNINNNNSGGSGS